jgi:hypothetical protein
VKPLPLVFDCSTICLACSDYLIKVQLNRRRASEEIHAYPHFALFFVYSLNYTIKVAKRPVRNYDFYPRPKPFSMFVIVAC